MQHNESDTIITQSVLAPKPHKNVWAGIRKRLVRDRNLYLMLLPVIGFYLLFKLAPLGGEIIAFKNYRFADGIWGSDWVGLKHFESLFASKEFYMVLKNTLLLNVYSLLFSFPAPIILALLLNEVRVEWYKRIVQNFLYLPHFISWVVLGGILITILSPARGVINSILTKGLGLDPIYFLGDTFWWPITFVLSGIWREAGWGTILYLAAMANVDPQLYEAAKMDGAGKLRQIWHITLPGIRSTVAILLILKVGHMMDIGFEQIFVLQNDMVLGISDVISTYVYRIGLLSAQYSYTTALGLFQSLIALILVISVNKIVKLLGEKGLW
ncbi:MULTISPECIES: ABC transporter permease [unclassified Paenibacillus]|uniref:ABC transporter permease n=1 Tax=unclassified Paenibacillus TaxID=185978 RepID=UPI003627510C